MNQRLREIQLRVDLLRIHVNNIEDPLQRKASLRELNQLQIELDKH
jgi:hypothetical protein